MMQQSKAKRRKGQVKDSRKEGKKRNATIYKEIRARGDMLGNSRNTRIGDRER